MENASDAIVMAGAMLIFVIALTVAMTLFSQARETIDMVVYASDKTNYYQYLDVASSNGIKNRIVSWETVIPTLYKYYKENYTVVFLDKNGNGMNLYDTQTEQKLWASGNKDYTSTVVSKYPGRKSKDISICSFDVDEETTRHEPWTGSTIDYKNNLDAFIEGKIFYYPTGSGEKYDYSKNGRRFNKSSWWTKC